MRVSASEPPVCLDFSIQGTSELTSRTRGREMPAAGMHGLITESPPHPAAARINHLQDLLSGTEHNRKIPPRTESPTNHNYVGLLAGKVTPSWFCRDLGL